MNNDLKWMINIFLFALLIVLVISGIQWSISVTTEHQKVVNISAKYHVLHNDISVFYMQGSNVIADRNVIFDDDNIIYLISDNDYDKCNVGERMQISYKKFYLPFMENRAVNTSRLVMVE